MQGKRQKAKGKRQKFILCIAALAATSCGYHVANHANALPPRIKTIAVPAFGNLTARPKLSDKLASEITREFIRRTKYRIVSDANAADAVLNGAVINFAAYPTTTYDQPGKGSRASAVQAIVTLSINLTDRSDGKQLFNRPSMEFRERYEISIDPAYYFDESDTAMIRLSRDVARGVVSAVLERF